MPHPHLRPPKTIYPTANTDSASQQLDGAESHLPLSNRRHHGRTGARPQAEAYEFIFRPMFPDSRMPNFSTPMVTTARFFAAASWGIAGVLLVTGCGVIGLGRHLDEADTRGSVRMHVKSGSRKPPVSSVAVALRRQVDGRLVFACGLKLRPDGFGSLGLDARESYLIGAFDDINRNDRRDPGEPVDWREDIRPVAITSAQPRTTLELVPDASNALPPDVELSLPVEPLHADSSHRSVALGDVASVDDPRFAPKTGWSGLWRPLSAVREQAYGIYFTESYDPNRVPVIFVYGIGGSPHDWSYLEKHLDHSNHQFWFYHYPSGVRLDRAASGLAEAIRVTKRNYGYSRCIVMAHSMGGLVARSACLDLTAHGEAGYVSRLVTISTPWSGHSAAAEGLRRLRRPVLSWHDVAEGSAFLRSHYDARWPSSIRHDVIYGEKAGSPAWLDGPSDGVVTVASQRDARVVMHASTVVRLEHDHTGILTSPDTVDLVNQRLRTGRHSVR